MDIYLSVSDNGETFSPPVRVNATPGEARVNGEQSPRIALVPKTSGAPSVIVVWTAKRAEGTVLLTARSDDAGRSFGPSMLIPGTDAPGTAVGKRWASIPPARCMSWLDHRRLAADSKVESTHRHGATAQPAGDSEGMAQFSDLYVSTLEDQTAPMPLTAGVCYCCKTAIAAGSGGTMHLAWRHVYPGNLRDIAFATLRGAACTVTDRCASARPVEAARMSRRRPCDGRR
jgi:hypothetical protein